MRVRRDVLSHRQQRVLLRQITIRCICGRPTSVARPGIETTKSRFAELCRRARRAAMTEAEKQSYQNTAEHPYRPVRCGIR
jgi:hypothetical protein